MKRFIAFVIAVLFGIVVAEGLERLAGAPWLLARGLGGIAAVAVYVAIFRVARLGVADRR
jgi:hypothetical protein